MEGGGPEGKGKEQPLFSNRSMDTSSVSAEVVMPGRNEIKIVHD